MERYRINNSRLEYSSSRRWTISIIQISQRSHMQREGGTSRRGGPGFTTGLHQRFYRWRAYREEDVVRRGGQSPAPGSALLRGTCTAMSRYRKIYAALQDRLRAIFSYSSHPQSDTDITLTGYSLDLTISAFFKISSMLPGTGSHADIVRPSPYHLGTMWMCR
jgi:hypothetical protein